MTQSISSSDASSTPTASTPVQTAPATQGSSSSATQAPQSPPKGKISVGGLGLAPSLTVLQKPALKQYNLFPEGSIGQDLPLEVLMHDQTLMDMLSLPSITQEPLKEELDLAQ